MGEEVKEAIGGETVAPAAEAKPAAVPLDFSPLKDDVTTRSYNVQPVQNGGAPVPEIPEPDYGGAPAAAQPPVSASPSAAPSPTPSATQESAGPPNSGLDAVTNPALNEADDKTKKAAAKQLVNTVLDGYEMLHVLGTRYMQYDEDKLSSLVAEGKLNPNLRVPVDEHNTVSPVEYVQTYNRQIGQAFKYDEEFNDKVRPPLQRIFEKKGWGMTDEQFVLAAVISDAAPKLAMGFALKKQQSLMMKMFISASQGNVEAQAPHEEYEAPTETNEAPPAQEPPLSSDAVPTDFGASPKEESKEGGDDAKSIEEKLSEDKKQ